MKQRIFYTELAYILGLPLLALGTAFIESTNFGLSMVVAPAYVLHLKLSKYLSFFSFGMASYTLQAILLLVMMLILRKAKLSYLFSFVTAVLYGFTLDGTIALFALLPAVEFMLLRVIFYILGLAISSMGRPVFSARMRFRLSRVRRIKSAWILISVACPFAPPKG